MGDPKGSPRLQDGEASLGIEDLSLCDRVALEPTRHDPTQTAG